MAPYNDDDNMRQDPLQNGDDYFSPTLDEERLPQDGATPAAPPQFEDDRVMPPDFPSTDTDVDAGGAYYAGMADESGFRTAVDQDDDESAFPLEADDDVN
jgi:hypothetical protein